MAIQQKLHDLDEMTVGRLNALTTEARRLIEQGAGEILEETRRAQGAVEGIQP